VALAKMPRCDGLPEGPCPSRKNDNTVRVGEGDLMLCKSCDKERFERFLNSKRTAGAGNSGDNTQTTRRVGLRSNAKPEANKNSSASSSSSVYGSVKESKGSDRDTAHTVLTALWSLNAPLVYCLQTVRTKTVLRATFVMGTHYALYKFTTYLPTEG